MNKGIKYYSTAWVVGILSGLLMQNIAFFFAGFFGTYVVGFFYELRKEYG